MERARDSRRASMATTNGLSRRRQRSTSLRDSPEDEGTLEFQDTARLRDRGSGKKDRDRDRDRDREQRDRGDRDRDRSSRSKRRRGERLMHGSHREDGGGDESTEESVNDDEDEDDDDPGGPFRMLPPNPHGPSFSSSASNQNHFQTRKSFPTAKAYRSPSTWKGADEMIGVSVPRKARSASTKRSHDCWVLSGGGGGVGGDQVHHHASASPVRSGVVAPAPVSPSSSNVSARKKMKSNCPKQQRPPKTSSKSSSSNQEEIEFEIAEVLYGLRQNQGPSPKHENDSASKLDSRDANKSSCADAKSRASSPISNSPSSAQPLSSSSNLPPHNSINSSAPLSTSTVAPKRKRPRPVRGDDENPGFYSPAAMAEVPDQALKSEFSSPNLEKDSGSPVQNGAAAAASYGSNKTPAVPSPPTAAASPPESAKPEPAKSAEAPESKDTVSIKDESPSDEKVPSPSAIADNRDDAATTTKSDSITCEIEGQRENYQIDLMAPPPQSRSSLEREGGDTDFVVADPKPAVSVKTESKSLSNEDRKASKLADKDEAAIEEPDGKKAKTMVEGSDLLPKTTDHQLDLERNGGSANKQQHHVKQQQPRSTRDEPSTEKTERPAQSSASTAPLPMSVAGWPSGISTMGYVGALQGVMPMDGNGVSSMAIQPPNLVFSEPRPKRCATHWYIARNIFQHQKFTRMNPFWPAAAAAAAGSASLYGAKPGGNLNIVTSTELHGNVPTRNPNSAAQDKGQGLAIFPLQSGGKDKSSQATNVDAAQRKQQILLQQSLPPGAPSNILAPAFIFPLNQQQVAAAATASARSGASKSAAPPRVGAPSSAPVSAAVSSAAPAPTAMSFGYPNVPANEAQYLAILQNNGYPFPIPAHVGAPPPYRGTHPQPLPFFSGSFYSSQMLHPSQIQQQQQQQQPPPQASQIQQAHPSTSISSVSSNSQKNQQPQQRAAAHGGAINNVSGTLQSFPAPKNRPLQSSQQQQQLLHNQHISPLHQARQLDTEMGSEDSPSTADSRVSRANIVYGHIHPPNFALMTPPTSSSGGSNSQGDKRQQPLQQQGLKAGVEPLQPQGLKAAGVEPHPSQAFAMSFASFGGVPGPAAASGFDISAMPQNPSFLQSLPEHPRHNYQTMAAAAQVAQPKNYNAPEEGKKSGPSGDFSNVEEERKAMAGKASASLGQSIAFSRPDLTEASANNSVTDNSSRAHNFGSVPSRASGSVGPTVLGTAGTSNSSSHQRQNQQQQQLQHQMLQLQQQQRQSYAAAVVARSKTPTTSNGTVYSENLASAASMASKFPNAHSAFPQNLVQSNSGSPAQSPQWKNAARNTTTPQVGSPLVSSTSSSVKSVPQQQLRAQQGHTQISFGGNAKSITPQGQQQQPHSSNHHQSASPPMMVGSPTTSSISKGGASGSPRTTTATSTGSKTGQVSSLSSQQANNSLSGAPGNNKSSPAGGRNISSILGNPHHLNSSSTAASKPPLQQQQQSQQPMPKQPSLQQAQLFYSNSPYVQAQAPHSSNTTSTASATNAYYMQRRRPEKQQQHQQQGSSVASSTGMLSLCPVTLAGTSTSDPAKAVAAAAAAAAAAASNTKGGGGLQAQGLLHMAQLASHSSGNSHHILPAGFPYVQSITSAVQLKATEEKQPAGE